MALIPEEDALAEDFAALDAESAGWDREARVARAENALERMDPAVVEQIYGVDIVGEARRNNVRLYGLTGGIGSGKSTVTAMLREAGIPVIDGDELAREIVKPGTAAFRQIVEAWPQAIASDGSLDRKRLGQIVFADPVARYLLENITHPRIFMLCRARAREFAQQGHSLVFFDAALLVETGMYMNLAGLVVVSIPLDAQIARIMKRDGCTEDTAKARIAAQLSMAEKVQVANHVIDNSGSIDDTRTQVNDVLEALRTAK